MSQNMISQSEHKFASENLRRNKKMSTENIEEEQTILLDSMHSLR